MPSFGLLPAHRSIISAGGAVPLHQQVLSRASNFLRTAKRDLKGQYKMHKLRTNSKLVKRHASANLLANGVQAIKDSGVPIGIQAQGLGNKAAQAAERTKAKLDRYKHLERQYAKSNAMLIGGTVLGTAIAAKGVHTYRKWRKKAKEKTQYRGYDVYPEHNYAAVAQQPYNQPYYNEEIIEHIREFKRSQYLF
jgi:hypothetical protein